MTAEGAAEVRVGAAVLGGGATKGELRAESGSEHKALIEIGGKSMLRWTVEAAQQAQTIGELAVVVAPGSPVTSEDALGERIVEAAEDSPVDSILAGFRALRGCDRVLLWAADTPLAQAPAVDDFVRRGLATGADCCYPIIPEAAVARAYPGTQRTFVRLREGRYTSGNMALFSGDFLPARERQVRAAFEVRKSPLRLSMMFGPILAVRFLMGRCSIDQLRRRGERALDCTVAVIELEDASLAFDVDKASDLRAVREIVEHTDAVRAPRA
ncbi:MAG: nucleotidyltransferase family protein [Armatimonadota bacterium]